MQYDHFYLYDEMSDILNAMARAHPQRLRLSALARSPGGRTVWLAAVTDFTRGNPEEKGGYYLQAGVHANEALGTHAALALLEELLSGRHDALLSRVVFYVVPRVNADGTEYALRQCARIRSRLEPRSDTPNTLVPRDLDGDGRILSMRVRDPLGEWKEQPGSGAMIPRAAGERDGVFYSVFEEGIFENYDGGLPVRGPRQRDFNRSLPYNWTPAEYASDLPCSDPEVRAVAEFLTSHPNIFAGLDLHGGTQAVLRPASTPDGELNDHDRRLILKIGRLAEETTGLPLLHERDYREPDAKPVALRGGSNDFAYEVLGISHYVLELGMGQHNLGLTTAEMFGNAEKYYVRNDWLPDILRYHRERGGEMFAPWKKFQHPQLGEVEIGGLLDGHVQCMHPDLLEALTPKTTAFALRHAAMGPELRLGDAELRDLGGGNWRVRAACMNVGELGTTVMEGAAGHLAHIPARVSLEVPEGAEILSRPAVYEFSSLAPAKKVLLEWFVRADSPEGLRICARHPKAGRTTLPVG